MEAQKWQEYQKQYEKYGFDMKPRESREEREARKRRARKKQRTLTVAIGGDKKLALCAVAIFAVFIISSVVLAATAASMTYELSHMKAENAELYEEIKAINIQETTHNDVEYITEKAYKELGLVAAGSDDRVYMTEDNIPEDGFAEVLRDKAFN